MAGREEPGSPMLVGGILADEMGLGKTWETIGLLLNRPVARTLLLVPPALQPQWSESLAQSGIAHSILGAPAKKGADGSWRDITGTRCGIHVDLSSYDRASNNAVMLVKTPYDRIICDEGHVLRNGTNTARFRALVEIIAPRRWILSGTPVQNDISDFYNLLKFLNVDPDLRKKAPIDSIAKTVILRRTVGEVRDAVPTMPTEKPLHFVHPVEMPAGEELGVFNALVGRYNPAVEANARQCIILELYLRIRQFIAHPQIYVSAMKKKYKESYGRLAWEHSASKADAFAEMLSTKGKKPTIVFTNFKMEMEIAEATLVKEGYRVWTICGGMSDAARTAATCESRAAVEAGNQAVAILVQIVAGGAGLNLQHCNRVVFLSSHWNPAVVDQAIARAYRMGQKDRVEVHHLLLADGAEQNLDRYMAMIHGRKRLGALAVHEKLFCDSAISEEMILGELDDSLTKLEAPVSTAEDPC